MTPSFEQARAGQPSQAALCVDPSPTPTIQPLRTLQLGKSWFGPSTGGLARMYHGLMRHLPAAGVQVEGLVVDDGDPALYRDFPVRGVASVSDPLPRRLAALRRNARVALDRQPYDVVASHFALYTFPLLDLLKPQPLVVHFHGPWAQESRAEGESRLKVQLKQAVEKAVYRHGLRFIVLSEAFRDVLVSTYRVSAGHVRIVPGGVDVARFDVRASRREARARLGWPQDRPLLLSVRRLVRRMGLENLVRAMQYVREHIPEALLVMAGKGPLAAELQAQVQAAGLERHVRLLGFVPDEDLPFAYRGADLSVVPTEALEGFGLITVESLAAGTPVLVTPAGGLPEVVRGLSEHLILPDGRAETLGACLTAALDGSLEMPSAAACREYARARFDWAVVAAQVRGVYEEVLR